MDEKTITTEEAWDVLCKGCTTQAEKMARGECPDWYVTTPEEQTVFGLTKKVLPYVATAYLFYEEILGFTTLDLLPPAVMAVIRRDLTERIGLVPMGLSEEGFRKFAQILYIGNRTAHAWYCKHEFWCVRRGIVKYRDETEGYPFFW